MGLLIVNRGDIFFASTAARAHGVNVRGIMGAGIAKQFRFLYPEMFTAYRARCEGGGLAPGDVMPWYDTARKGWVYNLATQDEPGPYARMEWVESSTVKMVEHAEAKEVRSIALPQIGCGVGGLQWSDVRAHLVNLARTTSVRIEVWML